MSKPISKMTSEEYKQWMQDNPEEAKKIDQGPVVPGVLPTGTWRNGQWIPYGPQTPQQPQ